MKSNLTTEEVFLTQGTPTHTYVSVSDGTYEKKLATAIRNKGTLCLITGPSKTGKTTLVSSVCTRLGLQPLSIGCDLGITTEQLWKKALQDIDFARVTTLSRGKSTTAKIGSEAGGKLGWQWLASVTGKIVTSLDKERSEEECREKILADPCPELLIPALQMTNIFLILEDFHYLDPAVQKQVAQQWKRFVDAQVSVAVLSTTHHAYDLAHANGDLTGRTRHLLMTRWTRRDLAEIGRKGFAALNLKIDQPTLDQIAEEAVGLPLVAQAIYSEICFSRNIGARLANPVGLSLPPADVHRLLNEIALSSFGEFEMKYKRIARGLRNVKRRKYNTYEYLLMIFTLDPIVYEMDLPEIARRLEELPIPKAAKPNKLKVRQALDRLNQIQGKISTSLLEWYALDETLYILEPSFLFYLRWRKVGRTMPTIYRILSDLISGYEVKVERGVVTFTVTKPKSTKEKSSRGAAETPRPSRVNI